MIATRYVGSDNDDLLLMKELLKKLGFDSMKQFKEYMKGKAKLNEFDVVCHTEVRQGFELNYSDNCKHIFGISGPYFVIRSGWFKGIFEQIRFN